MSDVIVLGVGGMGSAACYHLATRGARVLGIEQFEPGHALGSSHGDVRLIRQAYFEQEAYVPLLKRAYELWDALAAESERDLFHRAGLLLLSSESGGSALAAARSAAERHHVPIELLDRAAVAARFPQFRVPEGYRGLFEPGAGFLEVENAVLEHARLAERHGARIRTGETVKSWSAGADHVTVTTDRGTYRADQLVVTAGPWAGAILESLRLPLTVRRVVQSWFPVHDGHDASDRFPCFAFDTPDGFFYGFPRRGSRGLKSAEHLFTGDAVADPRTVDRAIRPSDTARVSAVLERWLPGVRSAPRESTVCMYTMTPDEHFVVGRHPGHDRVSFAGGFSGHGFKFASVIGEVLADLALDGRTAHEIRFLRPDRFPSR